MDLLFKYKKVLNLNLNERLYKTNIFTREQDFTHEQENRDICLNNSILTSGTLVHKFNNMILNDSLGYNFSKAKDYKHMIMDEPLYHRILNQFLHTIPSILNKSINLALSVSKHDMKDCFNISIKNKIYIKNHHKNSKDPNRCFSSLLQNLDITYQGLFNDIKRLCSKRANFIQNLTSNNYESLLTITESILKMHLEHTTDIYKPIKTLKDYKNRIDSECQTLYKDRDLSLLQKSDFNPFLVFEEISKPISYFKKSNILKIFKYDNNISLTIVLSIGFYMIALRSMFKIQTPIAKFAVAYSPVQLIPALVVGALHATSKIIEFAKKNNIIADNSCDLPHLKDFVLVLKCYLQGNLKTMHCSQCGNIHFIFKDNLKYDDIKNKFVFLCHSCETQERRASLIVENMVKHTLNEYVHLFLSSKKKLSLSTIHKNIQYFNCYNQNYLASIANLCTDFKNKD